MNRKTSKLLYFIVFIFFINSINAQVNGSHKLKVFVDGEIPDFGFIKRTLTFVDFVTDQDVCDIYVLTSSKSTGSNGAYFYLVFTNKTSVPNDKFVLNCTIFSNDTPDIIRLKFTETLKSGLIPFINKSDIKYSIIVSALEQDENNEMEFIKTKNSWNYWVFNIGLGGEFNIEELKKKYGYEFELKADRVSDIWRIRNNYNYKKEEEIITKTKDSVSNDIHVLNQEQEIRSRVAYSLSDHWSAGLFIENLQDTYKNTKYNISITPALEYNIFPWEEASRRAFTVSYGFGPSWFGYYEPTIFNKISDHRWVEKFETELEVIEKWGVIGIKLQGTHYFPKYKDYSIDLEVSLSFRIARGLFFEFSMEANKINDQFYLPLSELSDEELLLNVRKLPTSYEVSGNFGIRYQFGSIFNSIVNERL